MHPRVLVLGANRVSYTFPQSEAPVCEPIDTVAGHWLHPIITQSTESYTDYEGNSQTCRTHGLSLAKIAKIDGSRVGTIDLSPVRPELEATAERPTQRYREAILSQAGEDWAIPSTDEVVGYVGGLGVSGRRTSTDGLSLPGQLGWADLPDADGAIYDVLSVDGYAIPRIRASNQLYGVALADGTRWQRNGWASYPEELADYHPGHNGYENQYPWGTGFDGPDPHSQERYSVIGPLDSERILVVVEELQLAPSIIGDLSAPHTHTIDYSAWSGLGTSPQDVTGKVLDKWRVSYLKPFTIDPSPAGSFLGFGIDSPFPCGALYGEILYRVQAVTGVAPYETPAPPYPDQSFAQHASLTTALAEAETFKTHLEEASSVPKFLGMRAHTVTIRLEVVKASTGTTLATLPLRTSAGSDQLESGDHANGAGYVEQLITTTFAEWGLQRVNDGSLSRFWIPADRPVTGYIGGHQSSNSEGTGWGQWAHSITGGEYESTWEGSPATREQYELISRDAGGCAGTLTVTGDPASPSGIYLYWGVDGVPPSPTEYGAVRQVLTTLYAPRALTDSGGKIRQAVPAAHSTAHYCTDGQRVVFLPRPKKSPPAWISPSIPDNASADPDDVAAWNNYLYSSGTDGAGPNNLACYTWDDEGETLTLAWQRNTVTLTGGPSYYPDSGALHIECGDAPSNPVITAKYLWVVLSGGWGGSSGVSRRLCQISLTDGSLVASYQIAELGQLQATYLEVGDNLILHNRTPVIIVRDAGTNKILQIVPS